MTRGVLVVQLAHPVGDAGELLPGVVEGGEGVLECDNGIEVRGIGTLFFSFFRTQP